MNELLSQEETDQNSQQDSEGHTGPQSVNAPELDVDGNHILRRRGRRSLKTAYVV